VAPDAAGPDVDAAPPDTGFAEAAHPTQPVISNAGGVVLSAPVVVPVFFPNDSTQQAQLETFLQQLAQSSYWTTISHEYGVGALTVAPSVIATETPPTDDNTLQQIITSHAGGTGGWPAATPNTIYAVFLPQGVTLSMGGGTSCVDFGGYHSEVQANGMQVVYALMPRCTTSMQFDPLQYNTIATSHELLEASTDPHPYSGAAFNTPDDDDAIIGLTPGGELGDMCEYVKAAYQPLVGSFYVQRTWSNASAAAGHDPCVPVMQTPYVEAAANLPEINLSAGGMSFTTRGVAVPLGSSADIEIDLFSDAPAADWDVVAYDVASMYLKQPAELALTLDRTSGHNGDKLKLTVKRIAAAQFDVSEFVVFSEVNGVIVGEWFGLVSQ
jgi:hypothetical protein